MTFSPICLCGDMQSQHKMSRGGCRGDDCGCDRYEEDAQKTAGARAEYEHDQRHSTEPAEPDTLSTSARLDKAEQERDEALSYLGPLRESLKASSANAYKAIQERDLARAELASARQELEQTRSAADEKVRAVLAAADPYPEPGCGKHTGNASNRCLLGPGHTDRCDDDPPVGTRAVAELAAARAEIEQLRALVARVEQAACIDRERDRGVDLADRVQAIRDGRTEAIDHFVAVVGERDVLASHQRYLCETCGARYGIAYTNHEHGPLTPVTVTIARQGAPTE